MNIREKILIVEYEKSIAHFISTILTANGYEAMRASTGAEAMSMISSHCPDLVILDLGLPDMDGLDILRQIRSWSALPVVVVSARSHEQDKVSALDLGADDYLTKPFRPTILLMKVRALLRRVEMDRGKTAAAVDELRYGDLRYSATENAVFCGSTIVALTQTELRLLSYMMKQPEKAYSREELLSAVWGFDSEVETRVTDETLRRIRKKLTQSGSTVSVSTIWGFGYKLKGAERT